jgi:hypothetical protein
LLFVLWGFALGFWTFCLAFGFGGLFAFEYWVGSFWKRNELLKGKITEGKRIVEGKMLKGKGKNC